jgi:hypothetical protein
LTLFKHAVPITLINKTLTTVTFSLKPSYFLFLCAVPYKYE